MKYIVVFIFILGLIYILTPGANSITDYPSLPRSLKFDDLGHVRTVPNGVTYFSEFERKEITTFYKNEYRNRFFWGKIIPPLTLNHPPASADQYIRELQQSTFLEEYVYPLKESLYVNGYEPAIDNKINNRDIFDHIIVDGNLYVSKTTLRLYSVDLITQVIVYIGIWLSFFGIYKIWKKVAIND